MTTFEKLDLIADSYIPLFFIYAILNIAQTYKTDKIKGIIKVVTLISLIAPVYIIQSIDNHFHIWESFLYDYSSHTAFSLAMVFFFIHDKIKTISIIVSLFLCYLLLMIYQQYHTAEDIITTIISLMPFMYFISSYSNKKLI